jgi:hypothetical protein
MRITAADLNIVDKTLMLVLRFRRERMANPGQPIISPCASGNAVKRSERAVQRMLFSGLAVSDPESNSISSNLNCFKDEHF